MNENEKKIILSIEEQETVIRIGRVENEVIISTTDSTYKTKLDKLVSSSSEYELIKSEPPVTFYRVKNKDLISFRKNKITRDLTDEQRAAYAERLKVSRSKKH